MNISVALSLLTSFAPGLAIASFILRRLPRSPEKTILSITLGLGFGFGASSLIYFVRLASNSSLRAMAVSECALAALSIYAIIALRRRENKQDRYDADARCGLSVASAPAALTAAAFIFTFIRQSVLFIFIARGFPYGGIDALHSYTYRAVFFVASGSRWAEVFASDAEWRSNLFRPLLLTGMYARTWEYAGARDTLAPLALALFFTLGAVVLLVAGLRIHVKGASPFLAGLVLTGTPVFFTIGAIQVADIPISFYFLAAVILATLPGRNNPEKSTFIYAAVPVAFAAWTKSEGIVFAAIFFAASFVFLSARRGVRSAPSMLIPAAAPLIPVAAATIYMFATLNVGETRVSDQHGQMLARLFDIHIWMRLFKYSLPVFLNFKQWNIFLAALTLALPAIAFAALRKDFIMERICLFSLLITLCALFASCVLLSDSDYVIYKHAANNLFRFILQAYPSLIYLAFLTLARSCSPTKATPLSLDLSPAPRRY